MKQYSIDSLVDNLEWPRSYPWEAFITVRVCDCRISFFEVQKLVIRDVLRPAALYLHDQVAAFIVVVPGDVPGLPTQESPAHTHAHALLLTKSRGLADLGKQADLQAYLLNRKTPLLTHKRAIDIRPSVPERHPAYIIGPKNAGAEGATIGYYNSKLLQNYHKERTT